MAQFTEIGAVAVIQNLTGFNSGLSIMRKQMGITGSSARSFSSGFNNSMTGLGQSVLNAGRTVRAFGNELTFLGFQLTFLATGAFAAITQQGIEFESTMVRMSTLATVATEDLGILAQTAQNLGPSLGAGPTEMADAMFDIVSSGFSAAEAMQIIESTAKGAAIGLGDVRTVTDAVTSAMKAFSHDGLTAARATDILVQAVREGKGEVDALAGTIGRVTGIAGKLGVSFEEVAAFIATFTRVGVPAEVAVTSLRSALTAILKPTKSAEAALAEYKLSMDDLKKIIQEEGLLQALTFLAERLDGDEEAMGRVIGSARALAGVLINTGPLLEDYGNVLGAIEQDANQTSEAFDLFAQTTEFKLNRAKAAFESLFITVSSTLKPIINLILDQVPKITTAIEGFARANPALLLVAGGFSLVVAAAGPLLIIAGLTITSIGTLISVFGALGVAIGSVLSPIGLIVGGLVAVAATIGGLFIASFEKTRQKLADQGRAISFDAFSWGQNIVIQFARGMAAAITYVFQVLTAIANAITGLLKPGSPPKLLPDLDDWGKGAMEAYMGGWLDADFTIFQSIAQTIESFLRSMDLPEIDIVPMLMGMRGELAKIIDSFRETGRVSMDAIKAIVSGFGEAGAIVGQYIREMLKLEAANKAVERAQEALNAVQQKYAELLKPISDELDAIQARRQEVIDQQREAELKAILSDENAPALAKELALMELREIALKRQQRAIEAKRDADVGAAEETLTAAQREQEAAQARVRAMEQFIKIQEKNNQLIEEQISLLKRLADAMSGGGSGVSGGGIDVPKPPDLGEIGTPSGVAGGIDLPDLPDIEEWRRKIGGLFGPEEFLDPEGLGSLDGLFGDIDQAAQDLAASMEGIGAEIAAAWQPAIQAGDDMTDAWSDLFSLDVSESNILTFLSDIDLSELISAMPAFQLLGGVANALGIISGTDTSGASTFFNDMVDWLESIGVNGQDAVTLFLAGYVPMLGIMAGSPITIGKVEQAFSNLFNLWFEARQTEIQMLMDGFGETITILGELGTAAGATIYQTFVDLFTKWKDARSNEIQILLDGLAELMQFLRDLGIVAEETSESSKGSLGRLSKDGSFSLKDLAKNGIQSVKDMLSEIPGKLQDLFDSSVGPDGWITKIKARGSELYGELKAAAIAEIQAIKPGIDAAFQEFLDWIPTQFPFFFGAGFNIGDGLLQGILAAIGPLIDLITGIIQDLIDAAESPEGSDASSPSKKMIKVGHNLMDGLAVGMQDRARMIQNSMKRIVSDGIAAASEQEMAIAMAARGSGGMGYNSVAGPAANAGYYNYNNRESNFGPINVYGGLDVAALRALIRQEVNGAL